MEFCIYESDESGALRMGARAPWSRDVIVDVSLAEVAWLAARTASRRAYEVADHLVPAQPQRFFSSGAAVWEFARDAVLAANADTAPPRGERMGIPIAECNVVPLLDALRTTGELVDDGEPDEEDLPDSPVLVVVRRLGTAIPRSSAWDHVGVYANLADDGRWLRTPNELRGENATVLEAIAALVSVASRTATVHPGDVLYSPRAVAPFVGDRLELALPA